MSKLEIIPAEYGKSTLPEDMAVPYGDKEKRYPIVFLIYIIKTENKTILVDAGCENMPGFEMENFIGPVKALENIGLSPEDITDVIITHAHHDHIECVKYYKNAEIYIQKDEYENGKNYFAEGMNVHIFDTEAEICEGVKAVTIGGHSIGSSIVEINDGEEKFVIAGDECYSKICIEKHITTPNPYSCENNRKFIDKYSYGEYTVLLCHDR